SITNSCAGELKFTADWLRVFVSAGDPVSAGFAFAAEYIDLVRPLIEQRDELLRTVRAIHNVLDGMDNWTAEDICANAFTAFSITQDALKLP
ncbi:MAG TPA: hypothetical protein VN689_05930, partial [Burkholderiales bacterium]|nr:hypothetical protein [Burkholderiales bacterium]